MIICNDYLKLTKNYLRNYKLYEQTSESLALMIAETERQLEGESVKIASYGPEPGGGTSELTSTERAAEHRLRIEHNLAELKLQHHRISMQVRRIQLALEAVTPDELQIIQLFYFDHQAYKQICCQVNLSERSCRRKVQAVTKRVALLLFGLRAEEKVLFLDLS